MLIKINSSDAADPISAKGKSSKKAKRWPVVVIGLGIILSLIWIGYILWLALRFLQIA